MNQAPKDSHADNKLQTYAKDMPGLILRLQIEDNYLKQKYAKDMQKIFERQLPKVVIKLQNI